MNITTDPKELEDSIREAEDAFWEVIVKRFPTAKSGDLSPETTIAFTFAGEAAVREWIWANVPGAAVTD